MTGKSRVVSFHDRVAIVTGAGAGLGRSHAMLLASRGAKVVVNDPGASLGGHGGSHSAAEQVVAEIKAAGGDAVANYDSVSDRASAENIVSSALDRFGRVDIVVNNAGILRDKTFAKMDLDDFELVLKVHLLGTVYVTKAAWPHLIERKYGRVIFTTSSSGLTGNFGQSNYGTAKAAMVGLMNNLKNEGAKSNILVNLISPVAYTRMYEKTATPELTHILRPEQVSPAVAWLASDECDVSGEIIGAGGGYFTRIKIVKADGAVVPGAPERTATIEDFIAHRDQIFDLKDAAPYGQTLDDATKRTLGIA